MASPQGVMQKFINVLMKDQSLSGREVLDRAINECTNGKFSTMDAALDTFINEVVAYEDSTKKERKKFLADRCGIIMDNEDTGAIIGADASGGAVKTKDSIVDEGGNTYIGSYPNASTMIKGITFKWPSSSNLTAKQQNILARMNTIWLQKAMDLVETTYGVTYADCGVKTVTVKLETKDSDALAWASYEYYTNSGVTTELSLTVNLKYFESVDLSNENGVSSETHMYLDRVLAHELTHTFMQATVPGVAKLPNYVMEGMAELTHGIDDERESTIYNVFYQGSDRLHNWLNVEGRYSGNLPAELYAAGYMFFRYLMKQSANTSGEGSLPNNGYISYKDNGSAMFVANGFQGKINLNEEPYKGKMIFSIDAHEVTGDLTVEGNYRQNTIYLGMGYNTVRYGAGSGRDVIYNLNHDKGEIVITSGKLLNVGTAGKDVYLRYSTNDDVLQLVGQANQILKLDGQHTMIMKQDVENTTTYYHNVVYYGAKNKQDTLQVLNGDHTIHLYDSNFHDIDILDASKSSSRVAMAGSNGSSTLYGSKYDDDLAGSDGNTTFNGEGGADRIWCKGGVDTIMYGVGSGRDVVTWFDTSKDKIQAINNAALRNVGTYGNDVYLRFSTGDDVLQIKDIVNKSFQLNGKRTMVMASDRDNTVDFAAGTEYYGSKSRQDTLRVLTGNQTIHLYDANFRDVDVLDARSANSRVAMAGSNGTSVLHGSRTDDDLAGTETGNTTFYGEGGADRIWCKGGADTIMFGVGSGRDVVNWFDTNKDRIQSFNASLRNVGTYGNDVYLRYSTGDDVLQVKDIVNKSFLLDGKRTMVMAQDRENTVTYSADTTYYGSKSKQDTLKVNNGERVHLYDGHIHDIEVLDGRQATRAVLLGGGNGTGTLYGSNYDDDLAGTAGTTHIHGGKGNDRIWAKGGKDIIYFGSGDGQDTVYNGGSSDKLVFYDVSDISKLQVSRSGRNVMIGLKGKNDKVTLNEWGSNSLRSVQLSNGAEYRLNDNLSLSRTSVSYMTKVQAVGETVSVAMASPLEDLVTEWKPLTAVTDGDMGKKRLSVG